MTIKPIKYTWDVWRTSSKSWLVLLANKVTGDQLVYTVTGDDKVELLPIAKPLPDIRLGYPVQQRNVPPRARAIIRGLAPYDFGNYKEWHDPGLPRVDDYCASGSLAGKRSNGLFIPVQG